MRLYDPAQKPRGVRRLKRKLAQVADDFVHGWMKFPARGTMRIGVGENDTRSVEFDAHQAAYLAFASRELQGGYEPLESLFLESVLGRAAVFYDVGCNWGYFSLLAATHPRFKGSVFAFDVSAEMNGSLARMAASLELPHLSVTGYGLSDRTGTVGISGSRSAHLTQVLPVSGNIPESGPSASVKRLDDLSLPVPDLMKIDVEDHEQAVFEGGQNVLKEHHPLILFECRGDHVGSRAGDILCSLGYRIFTLGWGRGEMPAIELVSVDVADLSSVGQTNLVAVAQGDETRWFG